MKIKQQLNLQTIKQHMANKPCIDKNKLQTIKGGNDFVVIDDIDGV